LSVHDHKKKRSPAAGEDNGMSAFTRVPSLRWVAMIKPVNTVHVIHIAGSVPITQRRHEQILPELYLSAKFTHGIFKFHYFQ
jgi:hypothetical protein